MQPGTPQSVVEDTLPGSGIRYKADEVLIGFGGLQQFPDTGWNGWTAASAANPLTAGSHPYARLLVTSPDYPLAQFRTYYLQSPASSHWKSNLSFIKNIFLRRHKWLHTITFKAPNESE